MATVALHILRSSGKDTTPLLSASADVPPPPLGWSSSPLAGKSSPEALHSSGSKSDTSGSAGIPTPTDVASNAAAVCAGIHRKRRVVWDLAYRSSCLSSPKHRHRPYQPPTPAKHAEDARSSRAPSLETSHRCLAPAGSSSPARHTSLRHSRTSSRTGFKPPRSILKSLRNAKVSQYSLVHSSPGKRALHPSPGGRTYFAASPTASPRRRSVAYFANTRSPGRSPGRSPRVTSLSFGVGSKSPSLADITRLNGGGRKHTVAFPDLRAPKLAELGNASNGSMMMSMGTGSGEGTNLSTTEGHMSSAMHSLFGPALSHTPPSGQVGNASATATGSKVGLGLGQPFESGSTANGDESSNDADPRMHIISACHTLKYSLASPVWQDPSSNTSAERQEGIAQEDCFESQPFDFPPRNLEQHTPAETASNPNPFPSVHLRELEAAYATIFQYAQIYIQAWYNVASPESASTSQAVQPVSSQSTPATKEDNLDQEFAKLAPLVMKCVSRDVYRALHPVPLPAIESSLASEHPDIPKDKASPTTSQTKEARQALLHRSGLSNCNNDEEIVSSSPLSFPSPPPEEPGIDTAKAMPEAPKRMGRSTAEMRRRRNEINVVEAALQAFGTLVTCERFWRYFDVTILQTTMREIAQIPKSSLFRGPKYRELLSSYNWIIANQTLSTPAYMAKNDDIQPMKPILGTIADAVMATIESSTKNGEKARRVLSESFRAIRTLLIAYPSHIVGLLTRDDYIGKISFFAKYLCSPTKALRDNAALLLSAIAFAITANWDDNSASGQTEKLKAQEMVSLELYKYWTLSPGQFEIDELSRNLNSALESRLPSDYHFVRLVVNTLPIILGRRFRKMERKGPHMWLSKAVELKKREDAPNALPTYSAAFHLMTFLHVTYAWTSSSKEVAGKHMTLFEQVKSNGEDAPLQSDGQKLQEGFWGLGDKALRVVAQNVDAVVSREWDRETYANQSMAMEIDATIALVLSFVYAFTGLSYTAYHSYQAPQASERQQNPNLHRDLTKVWDTFTGRYIPNIMRSGVPRLRLVGWQALHALLRSGDEHPTEDAALRSWSMDRVINWRMLATYASQASQPLYPPGLVLAETVKPSELPSLDSSWVYDNRRAITLMLQEGIKALADDMVAQKGSLEDWLTLEDWIKNPDGHSIIPSSMSNCIRALFNTLREAAGQENSNAVPTDTVLAIVFEMCQFILCAVHTFLGQDRDSALASGSLSVSGVAFSLLVHLAGLLEQTFGTVSLQTFITSQTQPSVGKELAQSAFALCLPQSEYLQARSAYLSMVDYLYNLQVPLPSLIQSVVQNVTKAMCTQANALAVDLWGKTIHWLADSPQLDAWDTAELSALTCVLECAPRLYVDCKPEEHVQTAYAAILSKCSSNSPTAAWDILQKIIRTNNVERGKEEVFFAWATLPLLRDISLVEGDTFFEQISKTTAIAESTPQSSIWSLEDIGTSLATGLFKTTASEAARILLNMKDIVVSLCKSSAVSHNTKLRLYQAIATTFEHAYDYNPQALDLDAFTALLVCGPSGRLAVLVDLWNATYGKASRALTYSHSLQETLQTALDEGYALELPGWPKQIVNKTSQTAIRPDNGDGNTESIEESAVTIAEGYEHATIADSQGSETPNADLSLSPVALSRKSIEYGQENSQESVIREHQAEDRIESLWSYSTQMPSLSQIPEIPDTSILADQRLSYDSLSNVDSASASIDGAPDTFEETNTSVVPETQVVDIANEGTKEQRETPGDVAISQEPSIGGSLDVSAAADGTTDASLTETIPETQLLAATNDEANVSVWTVSPELSEIQETQNQNRGSLEPQSHASSNEPLVLLTQKNVEQPSKSQINSVPDALQASDMSASILNETSTLANASSDGGRASNRAEQATSKEGSSLPSPPSSVNSASQRRHTPPLKKRIVEVVIPYRPWLPRYPSTVRSGDENSQGSEKSRANMDRRSLDSGSLTMRAVTCKRKREREAIESMPSDSSLSSMRGTDAGERLRKREPRKMRLAEIAQTRYSQERARRVVVQHDLVSDRTTTSRQLKKTASLPTIIHSRAGAKIADNQSETDSISSSEEEVCVASSPNTRRISQTSDSIELARQTKRTGSGSFLSHQLRQQDPVREAEAAEAEGPTSSSPTTAASQRPRTYSHSTSASGTSSQASLTVSSRKRPHQASVSSKGTSSTAARTGLELAKLLTDGGESDIEEVLDDLSENQMKKLHQQLESRLKRLYGVKPVKKRKENAKC